MESLLVSDYMNTHPVKLNGDMTVAEAVEALLACGQSGGPVIDIKGKVTSTRIIKGVPKTGLDEAALKAVKKSRWYPARQRDKKVGVWITIPIVFSLTN